MRIDELAVRLRQRFPDVIEARGEVTVVLGRDELLPALRELRSDPDLSFGFLSDVTATDWPHLDPRYWVAYHLQSLEHQHRLRLKVGLPDEDARVPSVVPEYRGADWLEREVYDFFGIHFEGHPDLRRIEMPEGWIGHPLRKTEPLGGVNTPYRGAFIPPPDHRGL